MTWCFYIPSGESWNIITRSLAKRSMARNLSNSPCSSARTSYFSTSPCQFFSGIEATRRIRATLPEIHIIIVSNHTSPGYVEEALNVGAHGYVFKGQLYFSSQRRSMTF